MTATDELRRLLDERGVEWDGESYESCTFWNEETNLAVASEDIDGKLWVSQSITPAQAIAATLGSGTCRRLPADNYGTTCIVRRHGYEMEFGYWKCSECGMNCFEGARYCMNCGAKVVDE